MSKKHIGDQNKPLICGNASSNLQGRYWDGGWKWEGWEKRDD